jgi:GTPase SAR1 family protein
VIVGNKCDLVEKRVVSTEAGKEFAASQKLPFFETSAKDGVCVDDAFMHLAELVKARVMDKPTTETDMGVPPPTTVDPIKQPPPPTKQGCC